MQAAGKMTRNAALATARLVSDVRVHRLDLKSDMRRRDAQGEVGKTIQMVSANQALSGLTQTPSDISAPASARALAIAHPNPWKK